LTVIVPVFPAGELVCSFTITVMPPGKEMARFGLATRTGDRSSCRTRAQYENPIPMVPMIFD
jgi:hypothetical protein